MHGLFNARLLNRRWSQSKLKPEVVSRAECARYYVAGKSFSNPLTLSRGFIDHASFILDYSDTEYFVPGLHSN